MTVTVLMDIPEIAVKFQFASVVQLLKHPQFALEMVHALRRIPVFAKRVIPTTESALNQFAMASTQLILLFVLMDTELA